MTDRLLQLMVVLVAVLFGAVFVILPYDSVGGVILIGAIVVLISIIFLPRLVPKEDRRLLTVVLVLALIAKIAATAFRIFMNEVVYGGGDLNRFDIRGGLVAEGIRAGNYSIVTDGFSLGTRAMEVLTGLVYVVIGTSFFGIFLLSGFLGFLGAVMFYRAFKIAFPAGNSKLYAALIFFYPAVLYWPTGFGKDVISFLMLGLVVWGAAVFMLHSRIIGMWVAIFGVLVMFAVRPEVGLVTAVALITAFILRKPSRNRRAFTIQLIGVPLVLVSAVMLVGVATSFLGLDELSLDTALEVITKQSSQEFDEGRSGSNFRPPVVGSATWIPNAFVTVLFRPFPWEVGNLAALLQSFDGAVLGGIMLLGSVKIFQGLKAAGQNPILVFSIVFLLLMVIALATLGNFGLLARQRVIVLPLLFFILSAVGSGVRKRDSQIVAEPIQSESVPGLLPVGTAS